MPSRKMINPAFRGKGQAARQPMMPVPLRSNLYDPNMLTMSNLGTRPTEPRHLGFWTLREMARVTQPVAAIIRTRQNQVARFAKLPRYQGDVGIQVKLRDLDGKPTAADKKQMRALEDVILRCGMGPSPDGKRPGFDPFCRMMVDDTLTLDAMAVELREDRRGNLFDWWAVDGATIRLTVPSYMANQITQQGTNLYGVRGEGFGGVPQPQGADVKYVQQWNGVPIAEYTEDELAYWVRNPRTMLEANGYGHAELESLIEVVTGYLNAMLYNQRYFTHSSIPEGVLSVVGQYSQENLDDFRRYWNAMVTGVNNSWRVPILGGGKDGKGVQWTPLKTNNREMMFHEWMDFLTVLACAIYQTDREELGFGSKSAGEAGSLNEGSNQPTLAHSMSKGLWPLLTRIESGINDDIFPRLPGAEDFMFTWAGVDPDQEDAKVERETKQLAAGYITVNEVRAQRDMKAIDEDKLWGDAPANTQLYQAWAMGKQAELQAQGLMPDDQGGEDGGPGPLPKVNADGSEEDEEEGGQPPADDEDDPDA